MKARKAILALFLSLLFLFHHESAFANEKQPDPKPEDDLLEQLSLDGIGRYWEKLNDEYEGFLPDLEKSSVYEFIKNKESFSIKNIFLGFLAFLFHELIANGKLLGSLIILVFFSSILQTIHTAFEQSAVSRIAYFAVHAVLIFMAMNSFYAAFSYTKDAIDLMSSFMMSLLPLLLGLMASFGNLLSVSFFHPVVVFLIYTSSLVISKFVLPLLFMSALILIVSSLSEKLQINHLANLMRTIGLAALGAFLTIFLGVMSIQGAASAVKDGVAMKTTKFIAGNFIPVIGRTFTDATDTVMAASLLLKNAVGIIGVALIVFIAVFPAIKIVVLALIYKLAAALLQPVGGGPIIDCLNTISKYILYILACLLAVTLMFFLAVVIVVIAGNITVLMR